MKNIDHYDLLYNHPEKIITRLKTQFQKRIGKKFTDNELERINQIQQKYDTNKYFRDELSHASAKIFEIFIKEKLKETLDQVLLDEFKFDKYSCFTEKKYDYGFKFKNVKINKNTSLGKLFTNKLLIGFFTLKISKGNTFRFFKTDFKFNMFRDVNLKYHEYYFKKIFTDYLTFVSKNEENAFYYPFSKYFEEDFSKTISEYLNKKGMNSSILDFEKNDRYGIIEYTILLNLSYIKDIYKNKYKDDKTFAFFSKIYSDFNVVEIGKITLNSSINFIIKNILQKKHIDNEKKLFTFDFSIDVDAYMNEIRYFSTSNIFDYIGKKSSNLKFIKLSDLSYVYEKAQEDIKIFKEEVIDPVSKMLYHLNSDNNELIIMLEEKMKNRENHCYDHFYSCYEPYEKIVKKYIFDPSFSIVDFFAVCQFKYESLMKYNHKFENNIILESFREV